MFWSVFGISAWDLGVALCFGLYFGVGFGRCFVYCGSGRVDLGGGLRNGVKAFGWGCEVWGQPLLAIESSWNTYLSFYRTP